MSYLSGFKLGAAIAKNIRQFIGNESQRPVAPKKESFALLSALPGRRRCRIPGMGRDLAALLEEKLGQIPYMKKVTANEVSGSLLLEYDKDRDGDADALIEELRRRLFSRNLPTPSALPALPVKAEESPVGSITLSIRNSMRALSLWIKHNTGGLFDASSLAAFLFLVRGLRKTIITGQSPSGSAMLWWAASLMRGWRTI